MFDEQVVRALAATDERRFLDEEMIRLKSDDVTEVSIAREGRRWQIAQRSNLWVVIEGQSVRDTPRNVHAVLDDVLPLRVEQYVAKAGVTDLARYGLQPAQREVTFTSEGGEVATLLVGSAHDTTNRYVMLQGQPYVAVMTAARAEALEDLEELAREGAGEP